jgi:rod shape-determining protein MreC
LATLRSDTRPIIARGPSLGLRFSLLLIVSFVIMRVDHRYHHLDDVRVWLSAAFHPFYLLVEAPFDAWDWTASSFADRDRLRKETADLQAKLRIANLRLQRFESLSEENRRLRDIRQSSADVKERTMIAEILRVDLDPFRHRVLINRGTSDGAFKGQPILDANGVFGQITQPGMYASEVILISDAAHAIPVQVNRNGIRTIAVGTGDLVKLSLLYLTVDTDIKVDDLLVSSGLGGVFPAGYPVARVSRVERNPAATFAVVEAKPLAQLDRAREVLMVWYDQPPLPDLTPEKPLATPRKSAAKKQ